MAGNNINTTSRTVDEYIATIPQASRPQFDLLRHIAKEELPHAREVVSYGILGYKTDDGRAKVYISGWKDHVAMYPVPKNVTLESELTPYIKGKGTLWFALNEKLPENLIRQTIRTLVGE